MEGCIELLRGVRTHWSASVEGLVQDCLLVQHSRYNFIDSNFQYILLIALFVFYYNIVVFNIVLTKLMLTFHFQCSVEDLKKEYDLLKLKRMLFEYGVSDFNYSYSSLSIAWVRVCTVYLQMSIYMYFSTAIALALLALDLHSLCSKAKGRCCTSRCFKGLR